MPKKAEKTINETNDELIWLRAEPTSRRSTLNRENIAEIALALADDKGLTSLSMRNVASELGVGTMSLYHYVRNKDELITLMINEISAELLIPDNQITKNWRTNMIKIANQARKTFFKHIWVLEILGPSSPGPNSLKHIEQSLQAIAPLELKPAKAMEFINQIDNYVTGFALREAHNLQQQTTNTPPNAMRFFEQQFETGDYPLMQEVFNDNHASDVETRFTQGLNSLINGLENTYKKQ
ncbi:MAG: TetR/AcrR family transcriptional regulator [Micrococcaceae bacterium]